MNIIQQIFLDHFEEIKYGLHYRPVELENIERMIDCGNPDFGGAMYVCDCGNMKFIPFRCHSRFCPTCGNLYSIRRATEMSIKLVNARHRHCVFTIPEELRIFFKEDRSLLNCLFSAVRSVVLRFFFKMNKSKNFTPGMVCVLHTFGRPLEWNPHIHCLISEGAYSDDGYWRHVKHFNYAFFRFAFRTALLNLMEQHLGSSFRKTKSDIYKNHPKGFYVYAKPTLSDANTVIKYVGRYLGRPVISTKRIDSYDSKNDTVTFHYNRHEDEKFVSKTLPALDFCQLLMQHIPEKNFKMIRYYGLYARHRDIDKKLFHLIPKQNHKILRSFNSWRMSILSYFGYDPLECEKCYRKMTFWELRFRNKKVDLEALYERSILKYHSSHWKSSA